MTIPGTKKATREDVARLAGVSKTTVTNVLNNTAGARISQETRQRVITAVRKLNYLPSFAAGSLVNGRTGILGLLVPMHEPFTEFYTKMIYGLQQAAADSDYHFLFLEQNHPEKYQRCLARGYMEGIFILQSANDDRHISRAAGAGIPAVAINYLTEADIPHVSMDYEKCITDAVNHLIARDRKKICFICGGWDNQPNTRYRRTFQGLAAGLKSRADLQDATIRRYYPDEDELHHILGGYFDGIIVDGYEMSLYFEQEILKRGVVMGRRFDMVMLSESFIRQQPGPAVKVFQAQPEKVGRTAWDRMQMLLHGDVPEHRTIKIPFI